jgi:integrase
MYRVKGDPKKRRLTLDRYPALSLSAARQQAQEAILAAARGEDPAARTKAEKGAPTFAILARDYLEKHAKAKKRSWREDSRVIERELVPRWGRRKVVAISRRDVHELLDGIVERGSPIQANRTLALVRKIFNWAIGRGMVPANPCLQIEAPAREKQRQRVLSDVELSSLWQAFDAVGPLLGPMFKLRLLTAQRGGEVASMRWRDIDLDTATWTIPPEAAKNGLAHTVPLSRPAVVLLRDLQIMASSAEWVFPSPRPGQHVQNVQKAANRVRSASGVQNFVLHDLRRTAASRMTASGTSRLVVSKILNHVEHGVTRVYDRYSYETEKRQALDEWAELLGTMTNGKRGTAEPRTAASEAARMVAEVSGGRHRPTVD